MVFGILIDVPIIVGGYILMLKYGKRWTARLATVAIPPLATCMLLSAPLIIIEEQIDCMSAWCGKVLIPPTLPFLLVEIFVLSLIALRIHAKNAFRVASAYSVFGVGWEISVGGLAGAPILITAILAPYVWVSYGFVSLLPLSVLIGRKPVQARSQETPVMSPSALRSPQLNSLGQTETK